jgi:hypothetical protein
MRIEPVPVIGAGHGVPGPVRALDVDEDDACTGVFLIGVGPDIEIPPGRSRLGVAGTLEPAVLVRSVVDHHFGDDANAAGMRGADEMAEVGERAVVGMHVAIGADVVAVVEARRRVERQQPYRVDAQIGDVVEPGDEAGKISDTVVIAVEERFDVQLVNDRILVPELLRRTRRLLYAACVHRQPPGRGAMRQIAKGSSAGSSRMRCNLPCQVNFCSRIRSVTATAALSESFHSHSGTSIVTSCT